MITAIPCPAVASSECQELVLEPIKDKWQKCRDAVGLITRSFPHMPIPASFWEKKVCMDDTLAVMENGNTMIALANTSSKNDTVSLDCLAVDPSYQGSGIGSFLLGEVEKKASRAGYNTVQLMTEQTKPKNIIFYSKHGYKVTGIDPIAYNHSPGIKFEKKIF